MNWSRFARLLRLLYLARVPIFTLLLLAALGPLSQTGGASALLENLFDQGGHVSYTFQIALAACLLAYASVTAINLVLHYGSQRFPDSKACEFEPRHQFFTFFSGTGAAFCLIGFVLWRTEEDKLLHFAGALLGFVAALICVYYSKRVQLLLTDPVTTPHPPPFLIFPADRITWLRERFADDYCSTGKRSQRCKNFFNNGMQWPLELLRGAGSGYLIDCDAPKGTLKILSGHVFAATLATIAFFFYMAIGWGKKQNISAADARVPALAFVLIWGIVACWVLAALTFFFDRYRFPLLWTIAALTLITANAPQSDHFFRVETLGAPRPQGLTPATYIRTHLEHARGATRPSLILVATPGGGIQAAAWTVQVLSGLDDRVPGFHDAMTMISSVSGGSLGAVIYAAGFDTPQPPATLVTHSEASGIDEVAWGWTQPDFWRTVLPWLGDRAVDRGWALEEKWAAVNGLRADTSRSQRDVLLSDWAAKGTTIPALVLNSMLVERGQHVVFSTTRFPSDPADLRGIANFYGLYKTDNLDVRAVTAARLSASFPFVAPASRPNVDAPFAPGLHFVDGGYYDNNGVDSLIGWLDDAIAADRKLLDDMPAILILQVRHFNESAGVSAGTAPGWLFQTYAPLTALLNMWNAAPASRDRNELQQFVQNVQAHGPKVWLATASFQEDEANCVVQPLSWKLSQRETRCIANAWTNLVPKESAVLSDPKSPNFGCVKAYLSRLDDNTDVPAACEQVR